MEKTIKEVLENKKGYYQKMKVKSRLREYILYFTLVKNQDSLYELQLQMNKEKIPIMSYIPKQPNVKFALRAIEKGAKIEVDFNCYQLITNGLPS